MIRKKSLSMMKLLLSTLIFQQTLAVLEETLTAMWQTLAVPQAATQTLAVRENSLASQKR
jgi:hypothetical protein